MLPDGIEPDGGRSFRAGDGRAKQVQERWFTRYRRWENRLRAKLGLRRVPEGVTVDYRPQPAWVGDADDDPEAVRHVTPYLLATLIFAIVIVGIFWVFATVTPEPTTSETVEAQAILRKAVSQLENGDVEGAKATRDNVSKRLSREPSMQMLTGYILAAEKADRAQVEKRYSSGWKRQTRLRNLLVLAGYREWMKDRKGALDALKKASALAPGNVGVWMLTSNLLLAMGEFDDAALAADQFEEAFGGASPLSLQVRGRSLLLTGKPDEARNEFEGALMMSPGALAPRLGLVDVYTQLKDYDEALFQVNEALKLHDDQPDVHGRKAYILEKLGRFEEAEAAYRKAIELQPRHVNSLNNLAYLLAVKRKDTAEALKLARRAYSLAPENPAIMDTLGYVLHLNGEDEEAVRLLERAARLMPNQPDIKKHLDAARKGL
ncbi:MAG: tetratricopeptide repeat protein [Armatimonadetes bacterium]|nr:tetratricopeptide repeat protein [Armatimonadota bacterium]